MSEILGVIDALEGVISDGKKIPMSQSVIVDQKMVYSMLDKLRQLIETQSGGFARQHVGVNTSDAQQATQEAEQNLQTELIEKAQKEAKEIRDQTDEYADQVLAKLQLMVVKMQQNMIRIEKNLQEGRDYLEKDS